VLDSKDASSDIAAVVRQTHGRGDRGRPAPTARAAAARRLASSDRLAAAVTPPLRRVGDEWGMSKGNGERRERPADELSLDREDEIAAPTQEGSHGDATLPARRGHPSEIGLAKSSQPDGVSSPSCDGGRS
jgi:hypothetical protein